jgi:hypothetical protein
MSDDVLIEFSNDDLLRGKVVEPAWYRMEIKSITPKMSKDGGSTNYIAEGRILFNADDKSDKFAGVPIIWNFNSKAKGFMVGYFGALGIEVGPGRPFNLAATVGEKLDVYVEPGEYEGKVRNQVNHKYRAARD